MNTEWIWSFHGEKADFSAAVFGDRITAERWVAENKVSGMLTKMPLDMSVYDWAIQEGFFSPNKDYQKQGGFMQRFTSAYLEHYHYVNGVLSE